MGHPRVKLALPRDAAALAALYTRTVHGMAAQVTAVAESSVAELQGPDPRRVGIPEDDILAIAAQVLNAMWARHAYHVAHADRAEHLAKMLEVVSGLQDVHIDDADSAFDFLYAP